MSTSERGQNAKKLVVPSLEDDSGERKRVLNVLAQRRYRRRKREHLQRLEKLNDQEFSLLATEPENSGGTDLSATLNDRSGFMLLQTPYLEQESDRFQGSSCTLQSSNLAGRLPVSCHSSETLLNDDHVPSTALTDLPTNTFSISQFHDDPFDFDTVNLEAFETSLGLPQPSYSTSPSTVTTTNTSRNTNTSTPESQPTVSERSTDFPDETYLPMGELTLLQGSMSIARRLGCDSIIWSLEANSLFHGSIASLYNHLPVNLRPTRTQLSNPHHPALDILPWPTVRDRLILMFSQPENLRPPSARSPTALVEFVYDLEDPFEGARISGSDPYSDENWEVGEKLFQNWWWALDRGVLQRSNQLRIARGAALLGANRRIQEIE